MQECARSPQKAAITRQHAASREIRSNYMKRQMLFVASLCSAIALTVIPANAQVGSVRSHVPFEFSVSGKALTAGEYTMIAGSSQIRIQDAHGKVVAMVLANDVPGRSAGENGQIIFQCYKDRCFLSEVWAPTELNGRQLVTTREEAELVKEDNAKSVVLLGEKLPIARTQAPAQHFVCNVGYTPTECQVAMTVLKNALARYPVDALGEGGAELSAIWHMPIEDLLDLAIRHELAHALCNDPDETKTERAAVALKNGTSLSCHVIEQATTASGQVPVLPILSNAGIETPVKQRPKHKAEAAIRLRIYDFAGLEPVVLADAQKVTTEIFRKAGVETVWLDCPIDQAECAEEPEGLQFMLRILPTAMKKDIVAEDSLGFAIPCHDHDQGCLLYILYSRISTLAEEAGIGPSRILGHVMAHELGHGLLGPDAHEGYGVMQAKLPISDLSWKTLYFTSAQSERIRAALQVRNQELRSAAVAARFPITLVAPEQ
jgi:hypothetical protein